MPALKWSHRLRETVVGVIVVGLLGVMVVGIIYGVNYLSKNTPNGQTHTNTTTDTPKNVQPHSSKQSTSTGSNAKTNSSGASQGSQLSDTGPGEAEFAVFVSVSVFGTLLHYTIRKLRVAKY